MNKLTEKEAIEIRLAIEDRINIINKQIHECDSIDMKGYVDYWKDKLEIAQSAHKKLRHSILFMAGE
jgi:hypothetical protein